MRNLTSGSSRPVDQALVDAAIRQALTRFPTGYAGAAAVYTDDGQLLTSVCFDAPNEAARLCHETGAYCEANRLGRRVVASVCVSRSQPGRPFLILAPCGICQERLALWGRTVQVAVARPGEPGQWRSVPLAELQPHHWLDAVADADE